MSDKMLHIQLPALRKKLLAVRQSIRVKKLAALGAESGCCYRTKYRHELKKKNPEWYEKLKKKDNQRKKDDYTRIALLNDEDQQEQCSRWAKWKRKQRNDGNDTKGDKHKLKDMSVKERKAYNNQKKKDSQARRRKQKIVHDREKDRKRKSTMEESNTPTAAKQQHISSPHKEDSTTGRSRAPQYRQLKNLSDKLPKSSNSFAKTVTGIVKSASHRKKAELKKQGVVWCLEDELVEDDIKKHVKALKNTKGEQKWMKLCSLANMINKHQGRKEGKHIQTSGHVPQNAVKKIHR